MTAQPPLEDGRRRAEMLVFRVGRARFAAPLATFDEAMDVAPGAVRPVPSESPAFRGVFSHRGTLVPAYAPQGILGVPAADGATALVVRGTTDGGRAALLVDDVEDLLTVAEDEVRTTGPAGDADAVVRGVVQRDAAIIAIVDVNALVRACRATQSGDRS